jgi:hypothetical protein
VFRSNPLPQFGYANVSKKSFDIGQVNRTTLRLPGGQSDSQEWFIANSQWQDLGFAMRSLNKARSFAFSDSDSNVIPGPPYPLCVDSGRLAHRPSSQSGAVPAAERPRKWLGLQSKTSPGACDPSVRGCAQPFAEFRRNPAIVSTLEKRCLPAESSVILPAAGPSRPRLPWRT